jgi:hypothetical protein
VFDRVRLYSRLPFNTVPLPVRYQQEVVLKDFEIFALFSCENFFLNREDKKSSSRLFVGDNKVFMFLLLVQHRLLRTFQHLIDATHQTTTKLQFTERNETFWEKKKIAKKIILGDEKFYVT